MEKWQRSLYQPNLPLGADGTKVTASKAHITLSKEAAKEGMVLLKNNESLLPFQAGTKLNDSRACVSGRNCKKSESVHGHGSDLHQPFFRGRLGQKEFL